MNRSPTRTGTYRVDPEWRLVFIDEVACDYLGVTAKEALGRTLWELAPGLAGTSCGRHYHRAMERAEAFEFVGPSAVRPGRWLEAKLSSLGTGLTVQLTDVTERVERPRALAKSQASPAGYHGGSSI